MTDLKKELESWEGMTIVRAEYNEAEDTIYEEPTILLHLKAAPDYWANDQIHKDVVLRANGETVIDVMRYKDLQTRIDLDD